MKFYLGIGDRTHWLRELEIPLFVSQRNLAKRKHLPVARCSWALDSGGFTELSTFGEWLTSPSMYVEAATRYAQEIGHMDFMAPQDWMCEPWIIDKTGLSVLEHQRRTVANFLDLKERAPGLPIIPVLQGFTLGDYLRCVDLYDNAGVSLSAEPLVGLGSICRRQAMTEAEDIVLALQPLRLHGFGVKVQGLRSFGYLLTSADSMSWSFTGRRSGPCPPPSRCTNHLHYALEWRKRVLAAIDSPQQMHLAAASSGGSAG